MSQHLGNRVSDVGVVDKAVSLLDTVADGPCSLADITDATGLPRATAHRLAVALERHRLLQRDDGGRFVLGTRLVALGRAAERSSPLAALAAPTLEWLRDRTGESVQLYVRAGDRRVCVASLEAPHELRTIVPVGAVLPLDRGSAGRVLGAADGEVGRRRSAGWVESVAEREAGVASVSAAVHDSGGEVVAAVSVSGPIERTSRQPGRRYGELVVEAARRIERAGGLV